MIKLNNIYTIQCNMLRLTPRLPPTASTVTVNAPALHSSINGAKSMETANRKLAYYSVHIYKKLLKNIQ
jgi:hypothetical protein